MGGRGRGRGGGSSLTYDQLQSMGVGRGDVGQTPTLGPPPLYPKLDSRPLPLQMDASMEYMLILKKQFIDFLHDSPSYVQPAVTKTVIERYSDKYKVLSSEGKTTKSSAYFWPHMPAELRPLHLKKSTGTKPTRKRKLSISVDIQTRFEKLEKKEVNDINDAVVKEEVTNTVENNSGDEEGKDSDKEEVEDPDEEMDDGTDYVDNYFDNGEAFDDDDENLDDGPVY